MTPEMRYWQGCTVRSWDEDNYALEAWERMTAGGLKVPTLPGYPYAHAVEKPELRMTSKYSPPEWR